MEQLKTETLPTNVLTDDIKPHWFNLIRRLQSVARQQRGHAVITVSVIVDANGKPIVWTEPRMVKIEPVAATPSWLEDFLRQ